MNALTLPRPATLRPARSPFWRKFSANRGALLGAALILTFALAALLAPWLAPFDPLKTSFLAVRKAPSALNWLGTDELGRDLLSRLLWGARSSLLAGVVSVAIALLVGCPWAWSPATSAAGWTPWSHAWSKPCCPVPSWSSPSPWGPFSARVWATP